MQVLITTNGVEITQSLNNYIKDRIESSLSRFTGLIRKVVVSLSDENGPKGGIDTACTIRIKTDAASELIIKNKKKNAYIAVAHALSSSKQAIARHVKRNKSVQRKKRQFYKYEEEFVMAENQ